MHSSLRTSLAGTVALLVAATVACQPRDETGTDTLSMGADYDSAAAAAPAPGSRDFSQMSDEHIASAIGVINGGEIQMAQLAEERGQSNDVKQFARDMMREHTAMQRAADSLAVAQNVTPQAGDLAEEIQRQGAADQQRLEQLRGTDFDSAYMNAQVVAHQQALDALHGMRSAADDPEVRRVIEQAIPTVQSHLQRARQLAGNGMGVRGQGDSAGIGSHGSTTTDTGTVSGRSDTSRGSTGGTAGAARKDTSRTR